LAWRANPTTRELVCLTGALVDVYCASYPVPPAAVTLDIDTRSMLFTAHCRWNGHYGERCFLAIHVVACPREGGGHRHGPPGGDVLRTGKTPSGVEVAGHVRRLIRRIRRHWPATRITLRGDGHYGRP
jgi:hypothetical protein